jgi:predicted GH43/DUF377 family glycosyl hydrolase
MAKSARVSKLKTPVKGGRARPTAKPVRKKTAKKTGIKKSAADTRKKQPSPVRLKRSPRNPIITPAQNNDWESWQTFNPAAIEEGGVVHLLYRALGSDGISRLGYAASPDGVAISQRLPDPVFTAPARRGDRDARRIVYSSGGGWGGCEDPRLVRIGRRVYMTFVAFDGWGSVQMALTSIDLNDFLDKRWKWKAPALMSAPGEVHKNWVLFPEKINGKFAILHSISPKIMIDYLDTLDGFDEGAYIESAYGTKLQNRRWDSWVRGAGAPPIRTKHGWLLLYHAMDRKDPGRYKLGAMILDMKDPTRVRARSKEPILEPDEWYENQGHKSGVIYSCGAVVKDGALLVYYGGADSVVCVARAELEPFLQALLDKKTPKLMRIKKK